MDSSYVLGGGLEPGFTVLFSTIFQSIAQGNCHQRGKQWKPVEAKLLQFYVYVLVLLYNLEPRRPSLLRKVRRRDNGRNRRPLRHKDRLALPLLPNKESLADMIVVSARENLDAVFDRFDVNVNELSIRASG
jgi:hypothetical protein